MTDIQSTLHELAKQADKRISIFDIEIQELRNKTLMLGGRLLHESQLNDLRRAFPTLKLDTASIRILSGESHPRLHVATNLTGLYEQPTFNMVLSSELCYGTNFEVLDEQNSWVLTRQSDGYLGWTYRRYLAEGVAAAATHLILTPSIEVRAEPNEQSEAVTRLVSGIGVRLQETRGEWACISANKSGWIPSKHLRAVVDLPKSIEAKRKTILRDAQRMIGVPYLWGGTCGNGIDCSGFARLLHRWVDMEIPRDADMQFNAAKPIEPPYEVGDLFFFAESDSKRKIAHVGISLGGWKMIHSSRSNNGVYIDDLQERQSLMDLFVSAGSFLREA
jgi:gamma-D-glutamyl-L-lysine dipeptidyl-peptidase